MNAAQGPWLDAEPHATGSGEPIGAPDRAGLRAAPALAAGQAARAAPTAALPAAGDATPAGSGPRSLRVKGGIALVALVLYVAFMCVMVLLQREGMLRAFDEIASLHHTEQELAVASVALSRLDADLAEPLERTRATGTAAEGPTRLSDIAPVGAIARTQAETRLRLLHLEAALQAYRAAPLPERAIAVRVRIADLAAGLDEASRRVASQVRLRAAAFRDQSLVSTTTLVVVGGLGIALFAVVVVFFFARMTADLEHLARRTVEVVDGSARRPLPISRFDEVGQLAAAINELSRALDRREHDLELERRKSFHHEKMAAVGSLAAGVLTEIGNPIAAIDGYARALKEVGGSWDALGGSITPDTILEQTARLTVIAHEIAELAAPQPRERLLVDLNGVVEKVIGLLRFEEDMQGIEVVLALDRQLPAVPGRTDRLVQLVMNLIENAADAVRDRARRGARITIRTRRKGESAVLEIVDNGSGMPEHVRRRAFEPFFSTKPAGRGTGLGLTLCKSIVEEHDGGIELASAPGEGTHVEVLLPLPAPEALIQSPA